MSVDQEKSLPTRRVGGFFSRRTTAAGMPPVPTSAATRDARVTPVDSERTAMITDHWGKVRQIVLRKTIWFFVDDEVMPGTKGAREHDGHWYPLGHGVAVVRMTPIQVAGLAPWPYSSDLGSPVDETDNTVLSTYPPRPQSAETPGSRS